MACCTCWPGGGVETHRMPTLRIVATPIVIASPGTCSSPKKSANPTPPPGKLRSSKGRQENNVLLLPAWQKRRTLHAPQGKTAFLAIPSHCIRNEPLRRAFGHSWPALHRIVITCAWPPTSGCSHSYRVSLYARSQQLAEKQAKSDNLEKGRHNLHASVAVI